METLGCMIQFLPIFTLGPMNVFGIIMVPSPITASSLIDFVVATIGLKCCTIFKYASKGSSQYNKALPSGMLTVLSLMMIQHASLFKQVL